MKPERRLAPDTDIRKFLLSLSPARRARALALLGDEEADALDRDWPFWRHDGQHPPGDDWRVWTIMAGRGFGKTRAGAEWVRGHAAGRTRRLIALVGATLADARSVMIEGRSGLLSVADAWIADWLPSRGLLIFKNGSEARLYSGHSPEQLRGPEHHIAWCDELAKWEKPGETWDMLQLGMRLGTTPQIVVTTTPRPGATLAAIMDAPGSVVTRGRTRANPHLPTSFVTAVEALYANTRLGRQELEGELLSDTPGALWSVELLERCRVLSPSPSGEGLGAGDVTRTVIGVDPPSGDGTCGIIACALDTDGIAHVLADHSVTARTPEGWAQAVASAAQLHGANMVVAEDNQGGAMVAAVLRGADSSLRVKPVTARMSKTDRAVPVAQRFEAGRVRLHGHFPELEAQLCGLIGGGGYEGPGRSPDRADAMVWALTELMLAVERAEPRVRVL